MSTSRSFVATIVLVILYAVGAVGVGGLGRVDLMDLTPINLLLTWGFLLWTHRPPRNSLWIFVLSVYVIGMLAEIVGVQTGLLFGDYAYGPILGWKVWETPLMIGINWIIVTYAAGCTINALYHALGQDLSIGRIDIVPKQLLAKAVLTTLSMTLLDVFIEPDAMQYGMWNWANGVVPIHNYLGWLFVGFLTALLFHYLLPRTRNRIGVLVFGLQLLFFLII